MNASHHRLIHDLENPYPTLLEILQCVALTEVPKAPIDSGARRCHAFARYRCRKCGSLFCYTHARRHYERCKVLNGGAA